MSAEHGEGVVDLFEHLRPHVEREEARKTEEEGEGPLKLAIVGRPNAGKSTLINRILERGPADHRPRGRDHPRFDRDRLEWRAPDGEVRPVRLIDTAGMRKKAKVEDKLEKLAVADARRAVDFAEVVVLLLDGTLRARGAGSADRRPCPPGGPGADHRDQQMGRRRTTRAPVQRDQGGARGRAEPRPATCPCSPSRRDRQGHRPVARRRLRDPRDLVEAGLDRPAQPLVRGSGRAQSAAGAVAAGGSSFATSPRSDARPPTFVLFGTRLDALPESYLRYLINGMRRELGFGAVPIRLSLRGGKNPYDSKA